MKTTKMEPFGPVVRSPADGTGIGYRALSVTTILLMVLAGVGMVWSPGTKGQPPTVDYAIGIEKSVVSIYLYPGYNRSTTNAVLFANNLTGMFNVSISCGGLQVTPSKTTLILTGENSARVPFTITAPPDFKGHSVLRQRDCTVSSKVEGHGSLYRSTGFKVQFLMPYIEIFFSDGFVKAKPGGLLSIWAKVFNRGKLPDSAQIALTNGRELEELGFTITLDRTFLMDIQPDTSESIRITIVVPERFQQFQVNEYFSIQVKATSVGWGFENMTSSGSATLWVHGSGSVALWARGYGHPELSMILVLESITLLALLAINQRLKTRIRHQRGLAKLTEKRNQRNPRPGPRVSTAASVSRAR